jgi:hypothetical protein
MNFSKAMRTANERDSGVINEYFGSPFIFLFSIWKYFIALSGICSSF